MFCTIDALKCQGEENSAFNKNKLIWLEIPIIGSVKAWSLFSFFNGIQISVESQFLFEKLIWVTQ